MLLPLAAAAAVAPAALGALRLTRLHYLHQLRGLGTDPLAAGEEEEEPSKTKSYLFLRDGGAHRGGDDFPGGDDHASYSRLTVRAAERAESFGGG